MECGLRLPARAKIIFNTGNGRTLFQKVLRKINDSTYLVGPDSLKVAEPTETSQLINNSGFITAAALAPYAPLNSPSFSGVPVTSTPPNGTSTTQLADTKFVMNNINQMLDTGGFITESMVSSGVVVSVGGAAVTDALGSSRAGGQISIGIPSGATSTANGVLIQVTYNTPYPRFGAATLTAAGGSASTGVSGIGITANNTGFQVIVPPGNIPSGTYTWYYTTSGY